MEHLEYHCEIIDNEVRYTLREVCELCGADERIVVAMIREGIVEPRGEGDELRVDGSALRRIRVAVRLQRDLGVNLPGAALALDLLEELESLRRRLR